MKYVLYTFTEKFMGVGHLVRRITEREILGSKLQEYETN
jgi:hypothetical protein